MKKMIRTINIVLFFLPALFSVGQENKDVIRWQANRPLTWNDFRGRPQKRFAAASTSYDIVKTVSRLNKNAAEVVIEAVFFCKTSWKKDEWISESVLAHEQRHFDIVELFARHLRKRLLNMSYASFEDLKNKADSLYKVIDKEMDVYQDQYDEKTDGSMDGGKQREWNKLISEEIKKLNAFSLSQCRVGIKE